MRGQVVARRYAQALFDLGAVTGDVTLVELGTSMRALDSAIGLSPELVATLSSPVFTGEEKRRVLVAVLAVVLPGHKISDAVVQMVRNFCGLLADKKRLPLLGDIVHSFEAMLDARRQVTRATLCTAIELSPARRDSIRVELESKIRGTLELAYQVEPELLGGLTLRFGDRVLDASLRTQLDALHVVLADSREHA